MDPMLIVRYVILALSACVTVFGVLVMIGVFVPANAAIPGEYRIIVGLVLVLYGIYRFVITFNRPTEP